jgi:hypothetical protein
MSVIDTFEVIDGYFEGNRFLMRGLIGHAVLGAYTVEGLLSLARVIDSRGEVLRFSIDNDKNIELTSSQSKQLRSELFAIAAELKNY